MSDFLEVAAPASAEEQSVASSSDRWADAATVAVVLASAGRPAVLAEALRTCAGLVDAAYTGVVSVPDDASLPEDRSLLDGWRVVTGVRGLAAQRNHALESLRVDGRLGIVAFFDDDAVVRPDYLVNAVRFLDAHPDVLGVTGRVLLDGKRSGEIDREVAADAIARSAAAGAGGGSRATRELYGCNFVVRFSAVPDLRFDARLPLYSWLEDHDFARRLMRSGSLAVVDDCVIVHRAAASGGRQSHLRLGYSQVMNPAYLMRTGSFPVWLAAQQIFRPLARNILRSARSPEAGWRRQRLRGNVLAARDVARGRLTPERILGL